MDNEMLTFYREHDISPVKQDIEDLAAHYTRRRKLYRQCGIPVSFFRNADILEVGPGSGYNTLAFFHWISSKGHVDLVEANSQGIKEMEELFGLHDISANRYSIHNCMIEDFRTDKKYDIVIAEGFLPVMPNRKEIMAKLMELVKPQGIVVITCIDDACMFIEMMKRLIGLSLVKDIKKYEEKKEWLTNFFAPQLSALKGMSRSAEEWVEDQILNPSTNNGQELSLAQAINFFKENFYVLGTSPRMFTEYSWYKDVEFDENEEFMLQFREKRLSLLMAGMREVQLSADLSEQMAHTFAEIRAATRRYEQKPADVLLERINQLLESIEPNLDKFDGAFIGVFHDIRKAICDVMRGDIEIEEYPDFFRAFGRTQQYIAFEKK